MAAAGSDRLLLHATTIAGERGALVIRGSSGSGKSALALDLIALGAELVADDRTCLTAQVDGPPIASAPDRIAGLIEARGIGLLCAPARPAPVIAILDLDHVETARFPETRHETLAGWKLPLLHKVEGPHFPAALMLYLRAGKVDR